MTKNRLAATASPLGRALRSARQAVGLRQVDLAAHAGVSEPTVVQCEQGGGRLDSYSALASALGQVVTGRGLPPGAHLGEKLAMLRQRREMSARRLAAAAEVSAASVAAIEQGNLGVHLSVVERIATALGVALRLRPVEEADGYWDGAAVSSTHGGWTTPRDLLEQLYPVVGGKFDLDPCAPSRDRRRTPVHAKLHYTIDDDGLQLPWRGSVFLNPPYGRGIEFWVAKAKESALSGLAKPVIALIPARTDTSYFHEHIARIADVFLLKGRLKFGNDGGGNSAPFPSAIVVWGATDEHRERLVVALPEAWHVPPVPKLG